MSANGRVRHKTRVVEGPTPTGPILVVDDDPDVRDAMALFLRREGYEVASASEGREALDRLRHRHRPSLILLDLMMPCMDGFELRVQQMQDPELADIPVIVLSAGADLEHKVGPLNVAACLRKPIDLEELLDLVERRCPRPPAH